MTGNRMREQGKMCTKGPQVGLKNSAAAASTKPLHVGRMLYRLSYQGTQHSPISSLLSPLPLIKKSEGPSLILAVACDCDPGDN